MLFIKLSTLVPQTVLVLLLSVFIFAHPAAMSESKEQESELSNEEPLDTASSNDAPMVHNNNYDMLASDYYDQHPAESMQLQNFAEFYDPLMPGNNDLKMEESNQFLVRTPVRAPQPLTSMESRVRKQMEPMYSGRDRKSMIYLMKGTSRPYAVFNQWDQFDYDKYSMNSGSNKMYIHG